MTAAERHLLHTLADTVKRLIDNPCAVISGRHLSQAMRSVAAEAAAENARRTENPEGTWR